MENDDNGTGVEIEVKEDAKPLSPKQKLIADCHAVAMAVIQERIKNSLLDWSFEARRNLERAIEKRIERDLLFHPDQSPRVKLTRDRKTGLVSIELLPRQKRKWVSRLRPKTF